MEILLTAFPRLHVTLLDTPRTSAYSPGGVGFSIDAYPLRLAAKRAQESRLVGFDSLDQTALCQIQSLFDILHDASKDPIEVTMLSGPPQHMGFGSKSLLLNGLVNVIDRLLRLRLSVPEKQALTGRGGTSGIGVHAFYEGGLLWDAGHETPPEPTGLLPSSMARPDKLPVMMSRWNVHNWRVALLLPEGISHSAETEKKVFEDHADFPSLERGKLWTAVFNGFLPALVSESQEIVARSLRDIHSTGFKAAELAAQSSNVRALYHSLSSAGLACGMSSMGPLIYVLMHSSVAEGISKKLSLMDIHIVNSTVRNEGFIVQEMGRT